MPCDLQQEGDDLTGNPLTSATKNEGIFNRPWSSCRGTIVRVGTHNGRAGGVWRSAERSPLSRKFEELAASLQNLKSINECGDGPRK